MTKLRHLHGPYRLKLIPELKDSLWTRGYGPSFIYVQDEDAFVWKDRNLASHSARKVCYLSIVVGLSFLPKKEDFHKFVSGTGGEVTVQKLAFFKDTVDRKVFWNFICNNNLHTNRADFTKMGFVWDRTVFFKKLFQYKSTFGELPHLEEGASFHSIIRNEYGSRRFLDGKTIEWDGEQYPAVYPQGEKRVS